MDFQREYSAKQITIDDALQKIKSNDIVMTGLSGCAASGIFQRIHEIDDRVENVRVSTSLEFETYPYQDPKREIKNIKNMSFFYGQSSRMMQPIGRATMIPSHFRRFAWVGIDNKRPNIFTATVTPMDKFGYFHMSLSVTFERAFLEAADTVILEVNDKMPRVLGDTIVHISEVDYIIENNHALVSTQAAVPGEKEMLVGNFIADMVEDGDTFQLGIGGIPNAVAASMMNKRNLGIHTEMYTEGMMELTKAGVVTNRCKTLHKGKSVAAFAFGSQDLYDFLDDNPGIEFMAGSYVNDPYVISQNDNMISINTTLQVDLTGQCCSESIGNRQYSGTGGQTDTVEGALLSKGGRSIIALLSTTKDEKISKITPFLTLGSAVTLSRNDVDYVVTEYGVAKLRGMGVGERAANLIQIAHPKFRNELAEMAEQNQIW